MAQEKLLNSHFSKTEFPLEEGEELLQEMQEQHDELSQHQDTLQQLYASAQRLIPLRPRHEKLIKPMEIVAICRFQNNEV